MSLLIILLIGCVPKEEEPTATAVSTPIAAVPINTTRQATPLPTPTTTTTKLPRPTSTPFPTTAVTLIPTFTPIFIHTPDPTPTYPFYETKPIFLAYGGFFGDGGYNGQEYHGAGTTPRLLIFGDGQLLLRRGELGSYTYLETYLTPREMCELRDQIEETGFLEPHDEYFTQSDEGAGAGQVRIQVEDTFYEFYAGNLENLLDDLAMGYQVLQNYEPASPLVLYVPTHLTLWIEEYQPTEQATVIEWPSDFPSLSKLWANRSGNTFFIDEEWAVPIFDLFSQQLASRYFREGDKTYHVIARPVLPHESSPYTFGLFGSPVNYKPLVNCEGEPAFVIER